MQTTWLRLKHMVIGYADIKVVLNILQGCFYLLTFIPKLGQSYRHFIVHGVNLFLQFYYKFFVNRGYRPILFHTL